LEVRIRYLSREMAKLFGSDKKREIISLSDNAKYEDLLNLLNEKYKKAVETLYGGKYREMMSDVFMFICKGNFVEGMSDKKINPNSEVLVAYADIGG